MGSRPRTGASMERRRRWAASGRLPPGLAARFTLAEQAVLGVVAAETSAGAIAARHRPLGCDRRRGRDHVRNAVREACRLGLVTVEERRITGFRNDTNIVRIVAPEWTLGCASPARPIPLTCASRPLVPRGEGANPQSARILKFQTR